MRGKGERERCSTLPCPADVTGRPGGRAHPVDRRRLPRVFADPQSPEIKGHVFFACVTDSLSAPVICVSKQEFFAILSPSSQMIPAISQVAYWPKTGPLNPFSTSAGIIPVWSRCPWVMTAASIVSGLSGSAFCEASPCTAPQSTRIRDDLCSTRVQDPVTDFAAPRKVSWGIFCFWLLEFRFLIQD